MNDIYNLSAMVPMETFPWEEVLVGLSKANRKASVFYGHSDNKIQPGLTKEQTQWYTAFKSGNSILGLDILLTTAKTWNDAWYRLSDKDHWTATPEIQHFPKLVEWIKESKVFQNTGRIIFFIQLPFCNSPKHVDEDFDRIPEPYKQHPEFLWITQSTNGKELLVNGVKTDYVTWFNSYTTHETLPAPGLRWSLRIDGKFTDEFKKRIL
jgi:hypothetical protein